MKKKTAYQLPKTTPEKCAAQLKKGMGKEPAFKLADRLEKNLKGINVGDVNHDIIPIETVRREERFWTHVRNILAK
jgi:hypothetical protein